MKEDFDKKSSLMKEDAKQKMQAGHAVAPDAAAGDLRASAGRPAEEGSRGDARHLRRSSRPWCRRSPSARTSSWCSSAARRWSTASRRSTSPTRSSAPTTRRPAARSSAVPLGLAAPLDVPAIERVMPHRFPFLLIDRVSSSATTRSWRSRTSAPTSRTSPATSPAIRSCRACSGRGDGAGGRGAGDEHPGRSGRASRSSSSWASTR